MTKPLHPALEPYRGGFTVEAEHPICDEEWLLDEENSTSDTLIFLGYDANLWPLPDFSKWPRKTVYQKKWYQKVVSTALERTKQFQGDVYLDDVLIRKGETK